jgi:hypothetical protein
MTGPVSNDYLQSDNFTASTTNWSPCGSSGEVIITIEATIDAKDPKSDSKITVCTLLIQSPITTDCIALGGLDRLPVRKAGRKVEPPVLIEDAAKSG